MAARGPAAPSTCTPDTAAAAAFPRRRAWLACSSTTNDMRSAPGVFRCRAHQLELAALIVLGQAIPLVSRGEAALRTQREPLERHDPRRLLETCAQDLL